MAEVENTVQTDEKCVRIDQTEGTHNEIPNEARNKTVRFIGTNRKLKIQKTYERN